MNNVYDQARRSEIVLSVVDDDGSTRILRLIPEFYTDKSSDEVIVKIPFEDSKLLTSETVLTQVEEAVTKVLGDGSSINLSDYYKKSEIDSKLNSDILDKIYTKTQTDSLLLMKIDKSVLESNYTNNIKLKKQLLLKVDKTSVDALIEENNKRFQQLTNDVVATEGKISANYDTLSKTLVDTKTEVFTKITDLTNSLTTTSDEIAKKFTDTNKTIAENRTESLNKDLEHDNEIANLKK